MAELGVCTYRVIPSCPSLGLCSPGPICTSVSAERQFWPGSCHHHRSGADAEQIWLGFEVLRREQASLGQALDGEVAGNDKL